MIAKEDLWPAELLLWNDLVGDGDRPRRRHGRRRIGMSSWYRGRTGVDEAMNVNDRRIRGQLICQLATNRGGVRMSGKPVIHLIDKEVVGELDFEAANLLFPLVFEDCVLERINLDQAEAPGLYVINSRLQSLTAHQLKTGNIYLRNTKVAEEVGLIDAHIGGVFNLVEAHFTNPDVTLNAHNIRVDGDMIGDNFISDGQVELTGGRIGGFLDLTEATMTNRNGPALCADCLTVGQDMVCRGLTAHGEVRLQGACIAGVLYMAEARIETSNNGNGHALSADLMTVGRDMDCCGDGGRPFLVQGQLRLPGASLGGRLNLGRAQITNVDAKALFARGLKVSEDLKCNDGFTVNGETSLAGAKIGGKLDFQSGTFNGPVNLKGASVRRLIDIDTIWPEKVTLRDFEYDSFSGIDDAESVKFRLNWLERDTHEDSPSGEPNEYSPRIYNTLAAAYRADGQDDAYRDVLIAKLRTRSAARRKKLRWPGRIVDAAADRVLDWTVGYGYRPLRIFWWFAGMLVLGWILLWYLSTQAAYFKPRTGISPKPVFYAPLQALDLLLPVAGIGQRGNFLPQGAAVWWATLFMLMGWLFALILVSGLSGVFKRD